MESLEVYIPRDRRRALAQEESLPDRTQGAALFADISGFTPLTEALTRSLGARRGSEELTRQLNRVYDVLIDEVDQYGGSIISFSGDASTLLDGPSQCSGLDVVRYDPASLHGEFRAGFEVADSARESHHTPFGTEQRFIFCYCRKH